MTPVQAVEAYEEAKNRLLLAALCFVRATEDAVASKDPKVIAAAASFAVDLKNEAAKLKVAGEQMRNAVARLPL